MKTCGLFRADSVHGRVLDCQLSQNDKRPSGQLALIHARWRRNAPSRPDSMF
jgi:hypothetical protein